MQSLAVLLLFSGSMLLGCYFAGMMPLVVSFSEASLQSVSVFGAGLLVGTALAVIIPEGVNAVIAAAKTPALSSTDSLAEKADGLSNVVDQLHSVVGTSLIAGFVAMLIIDFITHSRSKPAVDVESGGGKSASSLPSSSSSSSTGSSGGCRGQHVGGGGVTATVGLVVHAAADGIALGAAVASSRADVEVIVFLAIMLHKAPAAFGLVSYLLQAGLERRRIRFHLLIFSLSAPVASVLTYVLILLGGDSDTAAAHASATGVCLLLSGGTFLYVATVHVLASVLQQQQHRSWRQLFLLVIGSLLPLLLSVHHHH